MRSLVFMRKYFLLMCLVFISTTALAATWQGDDPNNPTLWNVAENWNGGVVPTTETGRTDFLGPDDFAEVVAGDDFTIGTLRMCWSDADNVHVKINEGGSLTTGLVELTKRVGGIGLLEIDGGTLQSSNIVISRDSVDTDGTLLINSGTVTVDGFLHMGEVDGNEGAKTSLVMNGGTMTVGGNLGSSSPGPIILLDLNDGVFEVGGLNSSFVNNANKTIDIDFGTWIIDGDVTTDIEAMLTAGELIGFGGAGTVEYDYGVSNSNKTTVTAVHPMNPAPKHNDIVLVNGGTTVLSWDNIVEPNAPGNTVTATVWFGTDPNKFDGNYTKVIDGEVVTVGTRGSSDPQAIEADKTYYWQVDYENGSGSIIEGPVFEFLAINNDKPVVSVMNIVAYLVPENTEDGIAVISEDFTDVVDDTAGLTYAWTIEPEDPNVVFSSTTVEDPTITVTGTGVWTITLTVDDGYWVEPASAQLRVSPNACAAARQTPGYAGDPIGDITGNCVVDLQDFAILARSWLEDTTLSNTQVY